MGQETASKTNTNKKTISLKTLFIIIFILISILIGSISSYMYDTKTEEYKDKIYTNIDEDITNQYELILKDKLNTSLIVASSLSKDISIQKALLSNNTKNIDFDKLLEDMKTKKEYVNLEVELIDRYGISFKRSWTDTTGDDLVKDDAQMAHMIKYPRVSTQIKTSKYGMAITNLIPIYSKDKFIGFFGVNIQLDMLASFFTPNGFKSVILLNSEDSSNIIHNQSYTKRFLGGHYVVNKNSDHYLLKVMKENDFDRFYDEWENDYLINIGSDHLISRFIITDNKQELAKVFIFKSLEDINYDQLAFLQKAHIILTLLSLVIFIFLTSYVYTLKRIKVLDIENDELQVINDQLKEKTDEMDFNDKKLDNMFNSQPNLMMMHDGINITKANKRFMGFFNRFGTFEGFRQKHRCVSELFEKFEAPNYIWEQKIEGLFWIDYILENPRRLYKTVMSINGDPHHFIIKLNEMNYAKHVSERVIIVALVDMTQDLVNYKSLGELSTIVNALQPPVPLVQGDTAVISTNNDASSTQSIPKAIEYYNKYDIQYLIENSTKDIFRDMINTDIKVNKLDDAKLYNIKDKHCVQGNNEYKVGEDSLHWTMIITAQTLSKIYNIQNDSEKSVVIDTIGNQSKALAKTIFNNMKDIISIKTNEKVELITHNIEIKDKILFDYDSKLYVINALYHEEELEFYIMMGDENV